MPRTKSGGRLTPVGAGALTRLTATTPVAIKTGASAADSEHLLCSTDNKAIGGEIGQAETFKALDPLQTKSRELPKPVPAEPDNDDPTPAGKCSFWHTATKEHQRATTNSSRPNQERTNRPTIPRFATTYGPYLSSPMIKFPRPAVVPSCTGTPSS